MICATDVGCDGVGDNAGPAVVTCTTGVLGVLRRTGFVRRNRFLVLVLRAPKSLASTSHPLAVWPQRGSARQPTGGSAFGLWSKATGTVTANCQ